MPPSPKNHYATSTTETLAAGQDKHYKSPQRKLVLFFAKSRDAWKTKCLEAKTAVKRPKNTRGAFPFFRSGCQQSKV